MKTILFKENKNSDFFRIEVCEDNAIDDVLAFYKNNYVIEIENKPNEDSVFDVNIMEWK